MPRDMKASEFQNISHSFLERGIKPKGGRPKKDPNEKLSRRVQISFNEEQWKSLTTKAKTDFRQPGEVIKLFLLQNGFFK